MVDVFFSTVFDIKRLVIGKHHLVHISNSSVTNSKMNIIPLQASLQNFTICNMSSPLYTLNMLRVSVEWPTRKWNQLKKGRYLLSPFAFVVGFLFGYVVCPLAEGLLRYLCQVWLMVSKKIEKPIKLRKPKNKLPKKPNPKKKLIRIFQKPN